MKRRRERVQSRVKVPIRQVEPLSISETQPFSEQRLGAAAVQALDQVKDTDLGQIVNRRAAEQVEFGTAAEKPAWTECLMVWQTCE